MTSSRQYQQDVFSPAIQAVSDDHLPHMFRPMLEKSRPANDENAPVSFWYPSPEIVYAGAVAPEA